VTERDGSAEQARQNLMGKLSGKAKEVAGAVTGNDSLTAEGRLQQAEVTARQEAATAEAVAAAQRTEAAKEIAEKARLAAQHKQVAASQADADKARAEQEKTTEQAHADRAAEQKLAGDRAVAEVQAKQHKDAADAEFRQDGAQCQRELSVALAGGTVVGRPNGLLSLTGAPSVGGIISTGCRATRRSRPR